MQVTICPLVMMSPTDSIALACSAWERAREQVSARGAPADAAGGAAAAAADAPRPLTPATRRRPLPR